MMLFHSHSAGNDSGSSRESCMRIMRANFSVSAVSKADGKPVAGLGGHQKQQAGSVCDLPSNCQACPWHSCLPFADKGGRGLGLAVELRRGCANHIEPVRPLNALLRMRTRRHLLCISNLPPRRTLESQWRRQRRDYMEHSTAATARWPPPRNSSRRAHRLSGTSIPDIECS